MSLMWWYRDVPMPGLIGDACPHGKWRMLFNGDGTVTMACRYCPYSYLSSGFPSLSAPGHEGNAGQSASDGGNHGSPDRRSPEVQPSRHTSVTLTSGDT
jgi:hypothetical protein